MSAAERSTWPVCVFPIAQAPGSDLSSETTANERLAMMWALAVEAWTLAGRSVPQHERGETPIRVVSLREAKGPR